MGNGDAACRAAGRGYGRFLRGGAPNESVPDAGESAAPQKKSPVYRIGGVVLGVALVVGIFVGVIPEFASYKDAWTAIAKVTALASRRAAPN